MCADEVKLYKTVHSELHSRILQVDLNNLVTLLSVIDLTLNLCKSKKMMFSRTVGYETLYFRNSYKLEDTDMPHDFSLQILEHFRALQYTSGHSNKCPVRYELIRIGPQITV